MKEYWTTADGVEVQVFAHDAVNLLGRTTAAWRVDIVKAKASAALALELQTKVATLEAKLANPSPRILPVLPQRTAWREDASQKLHTTHAAVLVNPADSIRAQNGESCHLT